MSIALSDLESGKVRSALDTPGGFVRGLVFSADGKILAAGDGDGEITLFDAATGSVARSFRPLRGTGSAASASPKQSVSSAGELASAPTSAGGKTALPSELGATVQIDAAKALPSQAVTTLTLDPKGVLIATGHPNGKIIFWDAKTGRQLRALSGHSKLPVTALAFAADGKTLTSAGRDSVVRSWRANDGRELQRWQALEHAARAVAVSSNGKLLAASGEDARIAVWDSGGKLIQVLSGHKRFVNGLSFSGNNRDFWRAPARTERSRCGTPRLERL